jgi:hypothetical protein
MADPRQPVSRGQRVAIAADQVNFLNRMMRGSASLSGGGIGGGFSAPYTWVYAKNATGSDVARWGVMKITGLECAPTNNDQDPETQQFMSVPVLTGGEIDGSAREWCVALEPIANDTIGRVAISGAVQITSSDLEKLQGVFVYWKNDAWALVGRGGGEPVRLGKTTASWNKGALATINLYPAGTPGSESRGADAPTLEDCVNKFADVPADKWVIVAIAPNDAWYLIAAEC